MSERAHNAEVTPVYRVAPANGELRRLRVVAFRVFCPACGYLSDVIYPTTLEAGKARGAHNRKRPHLSEVPHEIRD